jgi:hypothetical protein
MVSSAFEELGREAINKSGVRPKCERKEWPPSKGGGGTSLQVPDENPANDQIDSDKRSIYCSLQESRETIETSVYESKLEIKKLRLGKIQCRSLPLPCTNDTMSNILETRDYHC